MLKTLQHEGFHQFAWLKASDALPIWLNEGLAEYFGDAVIVEGGVRHGIVDADRLQRVRAAQEGGGRLPLRSLLGIGQERWRQNLTSGSSLGPLQYDQAWAAVQFLIHHDPRVEVAFSDYLVALASGVRHEVAFPAAFGADTTPMEAAFDRFVSRLRPDPFGEALSRLRFLAEGLRFLHGRDGAAPADAAALETSLRASRFRVTTRSHGVEREASAADPGAFGYRTDAGEAARFTLAAPLGPGLPPEVLAEGLRPAARVTWRRDADGELAYELAFH